MHRVFSSHVAWWHMASTPYGRGVFGAATALVLCGVGLAGCGIDPPRGELGANADAGARPTSSPEDGSEPTQPPSVDTSPSPDATADPDTARPPRSSRDAGRYGDALTHSPDAAGGGPPYPIVLAHGLSGFEHLSDLEALPYYYKVEETLEAEGETVFVSQVDPYNDSYERGRELVREIENFLEKTDAAKVHLIGHSQGGLDARYAAHERPDLIASVVTIATPHGGTDLSDIVLGFVDHPMFRQATDALSRLFGRAISDDAGETTSLVEALRQFSDEGIEEFNRKITNQPGVLYASVAGRTDYHLGGEVCETPHAPDFIERWEYDGDATGATFTATEEIMNGPTVPGHPNDGLVRVKHAKWGRFLGCIPADHLDQVGQIAGDPPGPFNEWDHLEFFKHLVDWLHAREGASP